MARERLTRRDLDRLLGEWIPRVTEALKPPWTFHEVAHGRVVPIKTTFRELMSALRFRYYVRGWNVYALQTGRAYSLEFRHMQHLPIAVETAPGEKRKRAAK